MSAHTAYGGELLPDIRRMRAALSDLTTLQRQVLFLRGAEQLDPAEAGYRLNLTAAAVRSIFSGALDKLIRSASGYRPSDRTEPGKGCPGWCAGRCSVESDGSIFHWGQLTDVEVAESDGPVDLSIMQIDDPGERGAATVTLGIGMRSMQMTPGQALALGDLFREMAFKAAGTRNARSIRREANR
jgi:hypothetical protein